MYYLVLVNDNEVDCVDAEELGEQSPIAWAKDHVVPGQTLELRFVRNAGKRSQPSAFWPERRTITWVAGKVA